MSNEYKSFHSNSCYDIANSYGLVQIRISLSEANTKVKIIKCLFVSWTQFLCVVIKTNKPSHVPNFRQIWYMVLKIWPCEVVENHQILPILAWHAKNLFYILIQTKKIAKDFINFYIDMFTSHLSSNKNKAKHKTYALFEYFFYSKKNAHLKQI